MGTENIQLVKDLEHVIDEKKDEKEVPSLSKDVVFEILQTDQLMERVWRLFIKLTVHTKIIRFVRLLG